MDDPKKNPNEYAFTEKLQDGERLHRIGDLLIDVSNLIEALNTSHQADQIDHELTFPILPHSSIRIPEIFQLEDPDYITVTAGKTRTAKENDAAQSEILTYLSIDIIAGNKTMKINREGRPAFDDFDDLIFDTTQHDPTLLLRDELRNEPNEAFEERLHTINKVPRSEVNNLLISLAIPENQEFSHFADKDLLEVDTFTFLIEALRTKALESHTTGIYMFQKSETELSFQKKEGDESFTIGYVNPKTNQAIIASVDTSTGFDLKFSMYNDGTIQYINPTYDEIAFVHNLIKAELNEIIDMPENIGDHLIIDLDDPEEIAVSNVEERDMRAYKRLEYEVGFILNQDGFNPPNTSTT